MAALTAIEALLVLNISQFAKNLNEANKQTETTKTKLGSIAEVGSKFQQVGTSLTTNVTAPIVGVAKSAINTAKEFEASMSVVQALSGATGKDLKRLEDAAREMGATTAYSATDAAEALQVLSLAGLDVDQQISALPPLLYLAGASMIDLETSADIVTTAVRSLGYDFTETGRVADVFAVTMSSSATDTEQLGEAFKYVAPLAGALGFSVEDLGLVLGTMANAGIRGSQAGTTLRGALTNLLNPTDSMKTAMDELGIEITNSDGSMKSLREISELLRSSMANLTEEEQELILSQGILGDTSNIAADAMEGLTDEEIKLQTAIGLGQQEIESWSDELRNSAVETAIAQSEIEGYNEEMALQDIALQQGTRALEGLTEAEQASAAATIFGQRALAGTLAIVNASEEEWQELAGAIDNAEGAAEAMYAVTQDNLNGSLAILESSIQELAIQFGEILLPVIRDVVDWFTNVVLWLQSMDEEQRKTVVQIAAVAAAIGPVILIVGKLITAVTSIIKVLKLVGTAIKVVVSVTNPWVLVIGAVVAALIYLWNTSDEFREGVIAIFEKAKEGIIKAFDAVVSFFTETLPAAFRAVIDFVKDNWQGLALLLVNPIAGAFKLLYDNVDGFRDKVDWLVEQIKIFFTESIPQSIDTLVQWFQELPERIYDAILGVIDKVIEWAGNLYDTFITWIDNILGDAVDEFTTLPEKIGGAIGLTIAKVIIWGQETLAAFVEWTNKTIDAVVNWFKELPSKIWNAIVSTKDRIVEWGTQAWQTATEWTTKTIDNVTTFFKELPAKVWNAIVSTKDRITEWGRNVWSTAVEWTQKFIKDVIDRAKKLPADLYNAIKDAVQKVVAWGKDLVAKGKEGITNLRNTIKTSAANIPRDMVTVGRDLVRGIWNGIQGAASWFTSQVKGFFSGIVKGVKKGLGIASPSKVMRDEVGRWIPPGISVGIEGNLKPLQNAMTDIEDIITDDVGLSSEDIGATFVDNLTDAVITMSDMMQGVFGDMANALKDINIVGATSALASNTYSPEDVISGSDTPSTINIDNITVTREEDLTMLSRGLFNMNADQMRAAGR